jgi:phage terminase large subunit
VDTDWDLGVGDSTAIWFSQSLRSGEVRVIDYYEASGEGLPHYQMALTARGYVYGQHWAPHDIQVRELGSGRSRLETAASLGIRFQVVPNIPIEDGIHAVRMLLPRCWFDAEKTQAGLEAMQHYRRDYNTRLGEFKATPVHDWSEHGASAFRYLAVRQQAPKPKEPPAVPYRPRTSWG